MLTWHYKEGMPRQLKESLLVCFLFRCTALAMPLGNFSMSSVCNQTIKACLESLFPLLSQVVSSDRRSMATIDIVSQTHLSPRHRIF
jgi:hypothetical protein